MKSRSTNAAAVFIFMITAGAAADTTAMSGSFRQPAPQATFHQLILAAAEGGMSGGSMGGGNMHESGGARTDSMAKDGGDETIMLKDGSTVHITAGGTMRMIDKHGNRMNMKDGEIMETQDGRMIMMKNHILWEKMRRGTLNPKFP